MENFNLEDRIQRTEQDLVGVGYSTLDKTLLIEVLRNQLAIMQSLKRQEEAWEVLQERLLAKE